MTPLLVAVALFAQHVQVWETYGDQSRKLEKRIVSPVFSTTSPPAGPVITIDETSTFQTIDGFGASLTHSSAALINKLDKSGRRALMKTLFSPKQGAGLSLLRQPMGASDFTARGNFSYQDSATAAFSIAADLDSTIPLLRQALAINPALRIFALPWSPPAWMKTTNTMNGGSLRRDQFDAYAQFFVNFLSAYRDQRLPIYAVSMQNEPLFETSNYPSTFVPAADQATFLGQSLGPALAAAGFGGTRIIAYDHNWDHPEYPDTVLNAPYVSGAAFHCYAGDVSAQSKLHAAHPDKDIWFTECSGTVGSSFAGDLAWNARNLLIGATRNWARGVTLWNLALDQDSGPKNGGCDKCRGVVTIDTSTTPANITRNVEYFVLAHAAKFVRPGAIRIDSTASTPPLLSVAFRNPDDSIAVIVLNDGPTTAQFALSSQAKTFLHTLPKQSLATFVWSPTPRR